MKKRFFSRLALLAVAAAVYGLLLGSAAVFFALPLFGLCAGGAAVLALLLGLAAAVSSWTTQRVLQSMERLSQSLDLDSPTPDDGIYPEMLPIRDKLRERQQTLLRRIEELTEDRDAIRIIAGNMQKELERQREDFSTDLAQLRGPLTSIDRYGEQIGTGTDNSEGTRRLGELITQESIRLLALIDDMLRLSRLDETSPVPMGRVSLTSVCREALTSLSLVAHRRGVGLKLTGPEVWVRGDAGMLGELMTTLCENAIQYNHEEGSVLVETGSDPANGTVWVAVRDTGIGIPEGSFQRVFERFYQVDRERSDQAESTGLGLSIAKRLADHHQGSISLESTPGEGSVFTVTFPAWQEDDTRLSAASLSHS